MSDEHKQIDDGGPAFPPNAGWRDNDPNCRGMSLRDYFAAKAIGVSWTAMDKGYFETDAPNRAVAECAYQIADAMLAARAKNPTRPVRDGDW